MNILQPILNLLFPITCIGCGTSDQLACAPCLAAVPHAEPGCIVCRHRNPSGSVCPGSCRRDMPYMDRAAWRAPYDHQVIRELIQRLKYKGRKEYAEVLSCLLLPAAQLFLEKNMPKSASADDMRLLALPLHKKRERERGFNQAELLARSLSQKLHLSLLPPKIVERRIYTPPQVSLPGRIERQKNLENVFFVSVPDAVKNKIIVIVDDVATTGSTLNAAAEALKRAGAKKVWGLVIAKG